MATPTAARRPWLIASALLMLAADRPAPDPAHAFAGRFYSQFPDATMDGHEYVGENIVEIVPVAPAAAYVRLHLDYANGHTCGLAGVARAEGGALVYHDASQPIAGRSPCTLTLAHAGRQLSIDDGQGATCREYCGARGTLSGVTLPWASRRPITYLPRLRASRAFRDAMTEWRTGKPAE